MPAALHFLQSHGTIVLYNYSWNGLPAIPSSITATITMTDEVIDEPPAARLERFRAGKTYAYRLITKKEKAW